MLFGRSRDEILSITEGSFKIPPGRPSSTATQVQQPAASVNLRSMFPSSASFGQRRWHAEDPEMTLPVQVE